MKLFELVKTFKNDESGAVTVDWVVLTAAIVGLGLAVITTVTNGVTDIAGDISQEMIDRELGIAASSGSN